MIFNDNSIIKKASEIWISLKNSGELIDDRNLLIASVAIDKNLKLLTRNIKHYKKLERFSLKFY